jgi:hypothetical protein
MHAGGRPLLVSRPDGASAGRLSVDMLTALAQARAMGARASFVRPPVVANESLLALIAADVPLVRSDGAAAIALRARWMVAACAQRSADAWRDGAVSFWRELSRELRRQAGDERLPAALRQRLRETSQRWLSKSAAGDRPSQFPRRLLRDRLRTMLPQDLLDRARREAHARGIDLDSPIVAVDSAIGPDSLSQARAFLAQHGYGIVVLADASPLLNVLVMLVSRFVICGSIELQHVAYLTNTPSLTLNASDPFIGYPVRDDGLYTVTRAIDLDQNRVLTMTDRLSETYFRNQRNCGYRGNTPAEVEHAVREMHDGLTHGWRESESQTRFRERVVESGVALAPRVAHVAEWGPDCGFIGDGRLARFQADEAA